MHEKAEIYNDGQDQNNAFREDEHGQKMVTVDQAFEICGGYGRFQKINATFLIICMGFSTCFLYSFAFLEVQPKLKCYDNTNYNKKNYRICDAKEICRNSSIKWDYMWEDQETLNNLIVQLDLICESEITIGLFGSFFLAGIVLGSMTITRIGDIYGRRPGFMIGIGL